MKKIATLLIVLVSIAGACQSQPSEDEINRAIEQTVSAALEDGNEIINTASSATPTTITQATLVTVEAETSTPEPTIEAATATPTTRPSFTPTANDTLEQQESPLPTVSETPQISLEPPRLLYLTDPRMFGDDVQRVQQRLFDLGYTQVGEIDGYFGPLTEGAVQAFQLDRGLEIDGVVGPDTWQHLFFREPN